MHDLQDWICEEITEGILQILQTQEEELLHHFYIKENVDVQEQYQDN